MRNLIKTMFRRLRMTYQSSLLPPRPLCEKYTRFEFLNHSWNYYIPLYLFCCVNCKYSCVLISSVNIKLCWTPVLDCWKRMGISWCLSQILSYFHSYKNFWISSWKLFRKKLELRSQKTQIGSVKTNRILPDS